MVLTLGYDHVDPFERGMLPVSDIHTLHYEQYGKPDGKPGYFRPRACHSAARLRKSSDLPSWRTRRQHFEEQYGVLRPRGV